MTKQREFRVLALTGGTYPLRKQIRDQAGGRCCFDHEMKAWLIPMHLRSRMEVLAERCGLTLEETTVNYNPFPTGALRKTRRSRKTERLKRAEPCRTATPATDPNQASDQEAKSKILHVEPVMSVEEREKQRQAKREANDRIIELGSPVKVKLCFDNKIARGHVIGKRTRSYIVRREEGGKCRWDKSEVMLDESRDPIMVNQRGKSINRDPRQHSLFQ